MKNKHQILIIIPARGGSKGIPRKNLRALNNKPLIYYAIQTALHSTYQPDIFVSSEDDEILQMAKKLGAETHKRPKKLAEDATTLDPVIFHAYAEIQKNKSTTYKLIVTLQPTSPLLETESLDQAIEVLLKNEEIDTIISCIEDTHLTWKKENGKYIPNYKKRLNRQELTPNYKETGGFLITRDRIITPSTRIGQHVQLMELSAREAIDIDTYEDWSLCEFYLKRKRILFVVKGYPEVGLGHIYNALILANQILNHRVIFLLDERSTLGYEKIKEANYEVYIEKRDDLFRKMVELNPDVVINDILDTTKEYIEQLINHRFKVINFEDLGPGAALAHVVFNAIYPEKQAYPNHYYGPSYFCARDEFLLTPPKKINPEVKHVMITFGGTDPNNLTLKTLNSIYSYCVQEGIEMHVVTGFGYVHFNSLEGFPKIQLHKNISNISDYISKADIIFTSAGRTTYEIALIGTPAIVLAQNERELTHFFADEKNGFINLGLGKDQAENLILEKFVQLKDDFQKRIEINQKMLKNNIREGRQKVIQVINQVIEQ